MEEVNTIAEHHCKTLDTSKNIAINKRNINNKERWMWEVEDKSGIEANEIKHCPYCGEVLEANNA